MPPAASSANQQIAIPSAAAVWHQMRRLARAQQPSWLHQEVARRMADKLDVILLKPRCWLDWWASAGAGTDLLTQRYPKAQAVLVEPLPDLLSRHAEPAWRRALGVLSGTTRRAQLESDELPAGQAQLLWANMMLHLSSEPDALLRRWHRLLAIDGFLMFACLGPDTLRQLRALYARLGWPAPTLPFRDMHDIGDALVQAGFADPVMDMERITLTWATPQALLADLRAWGGNVHPGRFAGLRTPRWRAKLEQELMSLAQPQTGGEPRLALTFEIIYGHAIKPPPRPKVAAETTVSLDDMRALMRRNPGEKP
jgi:malonyl-CoA O-methyltransferase